MTSGAREHVYVPSLAQQQGHLTILLMSCISGGVLLIDFWRHAMIVQIFARRARRAPILVVCGGFVRG